MSVVVELKSNVVVEVSLDLPSKPTDASETNSTWEVRDHGRLSFLKGECIAEALKSAYMDALILVHRMPESFQLNGREMRGKLVYGVTLEGFFGFDGGIREKGFGVVNSKFALSLHSGPIQWAAAPLQHLKSRADHPFVVLESQYPDPMLPHNVLRATRGSAAQFPDL